MLPLGVVRKDVVVVDDVLIDGVRTMLEGKNALEPPRSREAKIRFLY